MLDLHGSAIRWLFDQLPSGWYVPPLFANQPVVAVAVTPARTVAYYIILGGDYSAPVGAKLYGVEYQPHPIVVALWTIASESVGEVVVARVPSPGKGATGLTPDLVRKFGTNTGEAVRWIIEEARRLHADHDSVYVTGEESRRQLTARAAERIEEARRDAEARQLAENEQKINQQKERDKVGFTVRRGHRVVL